MPTVGFSLGTPMGRLNAQDMGVPDFAQAIAKGLKLGYMPQQLQDEQTQRAFANKINQAKAQYAMQNEAANLAHTNAGTGLIGEQTAGLQIENQSLPEKLQLALQQERFKANNPLLSMPGAAGQIGTLKYLQENAGDAGDNGYADMLKRSLMQPMLGKGQGSYGKAMNDYNTAVAQYGPDSIPAKQAQMVLNNVANKGTTQYTNAVKTNLQTIITSVPKVKKGIENLIKMPSPVDIPGYRSDSRAAHDAKVAETAESYAKAKGWPNTVDSIHQAMKILGRGQFESDAAYRVRLKALSSELDSNSEQAQQQLNQGLNAPMQSQDSNDSYDVDYNKPIGSLPMMKDGQLFFIPSNDVAEALKEGYQHAD